MPFLHPPRTGSVVPGAGAFEVAVADALVKHKPKVKGRAQLGVQAFADALLIIPKVLECSRTSELSLVFEFYIAFIRSIVYRSR